MDEDEQNRYVAQLKDEFDSCDTTGTGYLDKEELTALCHKLSLDAHLPLLLDTLLGPQHYARVNFEEFKEGFVAVLSRSLDFSTSEEESSYLEPAVPEEVKPKYVKGTKRYGRRSRPDKTDLELTADSDSLPFGTDKVEANGVRRAKLRRSTSLESVESLKSDEDTGSNKESTHHYFVAQGQLKLWNQDGTGNCQRSSDNQQEVTDGQVRAVWEELGVGAAGSLNREELSLVCDHIGLKHLEAEELDALFRKLDKDQDGKVSLIEFQSGLFKPHDHASPLSTSTPARPKPLRTISKALEERVVRSTSPSLLSATVGQRLLTRLDDGSGCTSPEKVMALWTEEGIHNSRDILQTQTLDFSLEERLCLAELTLALDNELLVSGNGIHQAALVSYKNEINYLQVLADQACQERDKAKADLEQADRRNLQLVREVDDRHATMESLNESKIKDLEQEFRDKLTALRSESEYESEVLLEQVEKERERLRDELQLLRSQDISLQEDMCTTVNENRRLEEEVSALKEKLTEAESAISKLQNDLDRLLQDKYDGLDANGTGLLNQEEQFTEIFKEYEQQCRELQDRNDELCSELELLKSQGSGKRTRLSRSSLPANDWSNRRALTTESDSDDPEMKKGTSPQVRKKLQVTDKNVLGSLESLAPPVSIETELAMEKMKERYEQEVQDLKIQLETKVNFYERSMDLMRQNMEVERKDISQSFKMEISELEDLKARAEERAEQMRQTTERLEAELRGKTSGGAWGQEQERRIQRERAELEQNYAREISNLVLRLTSEKDQLEAELKLRMDREVLLVRAQLDEVTSENCALKDRLAVLQQDVKSLEEDVNNKRKKLEEMEKGYMKNREDEERLRKENSKCREEVLDLSARNLQLSSENAELSSRLCTDQRAVQTLTDRLAQVCQERDAAAVSSKQLQENLQQQENHGLRLQEQWRKEKELLERELQTAKEALQHLTVVESALTSQTLKNKSLEQDKESLLKETAENDQKLKKLQEALRNSETQIEQLNAQILTMWQEKDVHVQEAAAHIKMLQQSQDKVQELEERISQLRKEKEQVQHTHRLQEETAVSVLQNECKSLRVQNKELQNKVAQLQSRELELQRLTHECLTLRNKQAELETAKQEANQQAMRAESTRSMVQAQHTREIQELKEQMGSGTQEHASHLQTQLAEQQRRTQDFEDLLRSQAKQASVQMGLQQEQYEKLMASMQERMDEVEAKLKNTRVMLQEKVNQLKEQLAKNSKSDVLLKDLYVENSQLMKALQVTEQRQKSAEKKSFLLEEKVIALNKLLRKIAPASLTA
uniref:Ninein-like protein n=1 Tax=Danio rerio TaxID=7955 RepID=NINL_DANRE|nr:ninein-like protein [Danio rerio]G9G127.1 RecName: Full=Ninein-like protein [Danio rerio]AER42434.1 ninein-like protein [Danio rerio]|eukprot:NP_001268727.1 ninein-like protein [Danio rerio]